MEGLYTGTLAEGISTTMYNGTQGYDKNGNIGYLKRTTGGGATVMDELIYSYTANQLTAVADGGDATKGFKDKVNAIDYTYDQAGNMITDANKDLSIAYNYLNLPASITRNTLVGWSTPIPNGNSGAGATAGLENNGIIKHYYAGATKLRMETYDAAGTTLTKAYDYMAGIVYVTNPIEPIEANKKTLDFIGSPEGRAILTKKVLNLTADPTTGDKFRFEYSLKDHLGNLRVSCRCGEPSRDQAGMIIPDGQPGAGIETLAVVQEQHYDAWGLAFKPDNGQQVTDNKNDRFTYNSKELLTDLDLGWNDYGARMYMSEIGRWNGVDPLAELDFNFSPYTYVGNNPLIYTDPTGMKRRRNRHGTETDLEESLANNELTVYGNKDKFNEATGLDMHYRYLYYHSEDANYRKVHDSFVSGGNIAAGVAALPVAAIGAAEVGIGAIVSQGASYLARINYTGAGRYVVRKSIFLIKPRLVFGLKNLNYIGASADFGAQYLTNGRSLEDVNYWGVAGNLFFNNPLWSGAITTISSTETDRTFSNFMINSAGNALGNSPGLLLSTYSKIGIKTATAAWAIPRANFMGNIVSKGVAESEKKSENE